MQSEQFVLFFLFPPTVGTHKTTTESSTSSSSSVLPGRWTHFTGTLKLPSAGDDGVVVVVVTVLAQGESDVGSFNSEFVSINQRSAPLLLCSRNTGTCKSSTGTMSHWGETAVALNSNCTLGRTTVWCHFVCLLVASFLLHFISFCLRSYAGDRVVHRSLSLIRSSHCL